jgi:hypothetical protein
MDAWADERALFIWSGDTAADLAPVKAAKLALGIEAKVKPVGVGKESPPPRWDVRVLAIGSRPPWVCDYALVSERTAPEGWERALAWVLGTHDDPKATTVDDIIHATFGNDAREIPPEELEAERRYGDYVTGRE